MAKRVVLGVIGGVLGGPVGAVIGIFAGYGIAEGIGVTSRETQAYFQMLVAFPLLGLVGLVTGALAPGGKRARIAAGLGALVLFASCGVGFAWSHAARPAEVRVRNEMGVPFVFAFLGHDFRRSAALGTIEPGAVTRYFDVDLDEPGSFNGVHGKVDGSERQVTLGLDEQGALVEGGRFTLVVRESAGSLSAAIVAE